MLPAEMPQYRHRINATDVLEWVDSWWWAFARENGAPELIAANVLGRSLWDFIVGHETRLLYERIHEQLRARQGQFVVPFRCDSPTLRRYMRLTIASQAEGALSYTSALVRVEPTEPLELLDPETPRSEDRLTICSCCKRALIEPSGWLDIDEAAVRLRLFHQGRAPQLRYDVCPACAKVTEEWPSAACAT